MITSQYVKDAQLNRGAVGFSRPPDCIKVPIFSLNNIGGGRGGESVARFASPLRTHLGCNLNKILINSLHIEIFTSIVFLFATCQAKFIVKLA